MLTSIDDGMRRLDAACAAAVHPRVRAHPTLANRHAEFIRTQLSAAAMGGFGLPVAATAVEAWSPVTLVAWGLFLIPLLAVVLVSRTGRLSAAHFLSACQLAGLISLAATLSGGPLSFVAPWFILIPIEAAMSAHRWVMMAATGLAGGLFLLLAFLAGHGLLPEPAFIAMHSRELAVTTTLAAILYAGGLVSAVQRLHRNAAEDIARARDNALDTSRAKSLFLATMSHELKTPLATIIGFAEIMHRDLLVSARDSKNADYARIVHEQGEHLMALVNSVLDASKIEAGTFSINAECFDPRDLTLRTASAMRLNADARGVTIQCDVAAKLPDLVADRRACRQILMNIVGNALKFSRSRDVVRISLEATDSHLVMRIADTGPGIAPHHLEKLGQPFYQVDQGYGRRHEGAGLGLSIVKGLIALHGGLYQMTSTLGSGTTVTVWLPLEGPPGDAAAWGSGVQISGGTSGRDQPLIAAPVATPVAAAKTQSGSASASLSSAAATLAIGSIAATGTATGLSGAGLARVGHV